MYVQDSPQYKFHLEHYGHPSKVGFKDVIPMFKADKWDPEHLMDLYVKAGAKYFVSMGVHHDNFDMWNSRYHTRWNAAAIGPKKDIVGMWKQAARKRGLRFGVSEHLSNSFDWFATSHMSDKTGQFAGIPMTGPIPNIRISITAIRACPPISRKRQRRWDATRRIAGSRNILTESRPHRPASAGYSLYRRRNSRRIRLESGRSYL